MTISIKPTASGSTIEQDGSQVLSIDSNRNVGIGTSTPNQTLTVNGTIESLKDDVNEGGHLLLRAQSGYSYQYAVDNHIDKFRIIREDDSTSANGTVLFEFDSSGRVTMPYQPAFMATGSFAGTVAAGAILPFDGVYLNRGNHFNTSTYTFTAPVSGVYLFNIDIYPLGNISVCFFKNGSQVGAPTGLAKSGVTDQSVSITNIISLSANDTITVNSRSTQSSPLYMPHSSFSGYLIG